MIRAVLTAFCILIFVVGGYFPLSIAWRESRVPKSSKPFGGRYIKNSDGIFFVQIVGFPEQPTVVFIPGVLGWSEAWKPAMRRLAQEGYRAVAMDVPPFGISAPPANRKYDREAQAKRIKETIDNLRIQNLILVSHAEGTPAALTVAEMLGDRLRGLVLVSADVGWPQVKNGKAKPLHPALLKALKYKFSRQILASVATHGVFNSTYLRKLVHQRKVINDQTLMVYQTPLAYKGTNRKISDWLVEHFLPTDKKMATDATFYKQFKVPALIVWGEKDNVTPVWQAHQFKELLPQAQLSLLPAVGHIPQLENEKYFNDVLVHFVSTIEKPVKLAP